MVVRYSGSQLNDVQEPHPQPPPRKRGACSDVPHYTGKRYTRHLKEIGYLIFHG